MAERGISGFCYQLIPTGNLYQPGAGEELVQLRGGEVQLENRMQNVPLPPGLSVTSHRSWLCCFLP